MQILSILNTNARTMMTEKQGNQLVASIVYCSFMFVNNYLTLHTHLNDHSTRDLHSNMTVMANT